MSEKPLSGNAYGTPGHLGVFEVIWDGLSLRSPCPGLQAPRAAEAAERVAGAAAVAKCSAFGCEVFEMQGAAVQS